MLQEGQVLVQDSLPTSIDKYAAAVAVVILRSAGSLVRHIGKDFYKGK